MGLCAEQLYKMVLFFQKNEKLVFLINTTKWFYIFFGIWPEVGVAFTKWFWFFSKNNEYPYKMVCSFFGKM